MRSPYFDYSHVSVQILLIGSVYRVIDQIIEKRNIECIHRSDGIMLKYKSHP